MEITTNKQGKVGEVRKFGDSDKLFEIKEILENPQISIIWRWDSGVCPNCKKRLIREVLHDFYRIEILADANKTDNIGIDDIYLSGDTMDNRKMRIPKERDTFKQVLLKSKKYKKLVK